MYAEFVNKEFLLKPVLTCSGIIGLPVIKDCLVKKWGHLYPKETTSKKDMTFDEMELGNMDKKGTKPKNNKTEQEENPKQEEKIEKEAQAEPRPPPGYEESTSKFVVPDEVSTANN